MSEGRRRSRRADLIPVILLLGLGGFLAWSVMAGVRGGALLPDLKKASGIDAGPVVDLLARLWSDWWWVLVVVAAVMVANKVVSWWLKRRTVRRAEQKQILGATLANAMPPDWRVDEHLKVKAWRGVMPKRLRVYLTPQCADLDKEWRLGLSSALRSRLGPLDPIVWPKPGRRTSRRSVMIRTTKAPEKEPRRDEPTPTVENAQLEPAEVEELVTKALTGLMPKPSPQVTRDDLGQLTMRISYGETTRDQSAQWRNRVVDQTCARLGQQFRARWDRRQRQVTLEAVPPLPHPIDWLTEFERLRDGLPELCGVYGTDEAGHTVAWIPSNREPHALFVGDPGTGKTESMKAALCSLLSLGAMAIICDPKQRDFAEFLGRPGVAAVATSVKDRIGALIDLHAEVLRRNAAAALLKLEKQHPELAVERPAQAAIDNVPLILVLDELAQHTKDVQAWWAALSKDEKKAYGSEARTCPFLTLPGEIVQLARAAKVHVMVGMQRPDAGNFGGDSTAMRDMIAHLVSMGELSQIGSHMMWGDRSTGSDVVIEEQGEGMTNGIRIIDGGKLGPRTVGRFKSWYVGQAAEQPEFWERVAEEAPDTSLIRLPNVSAAACDPAAAIRQLREIAYRTTPGFDPTPYFQENGPAQVAAGGAPVSEAVQGEPAVPPVASSLEPSTAELERRQELLVAAAELVMTVQLGSQSMLQRKLKVGHNVAKRLAEELANHGILGPPRKKKERLVLIPVEDMPATLEALKDPLSKVIPPVSPADVATETDEPEAIPPVSPAVSEETFASAAEDIEVDGSGVSWSSVLASSLEVGDVVSFGDLVSAEVMELPSMVEDEFDQEELCRLVVCEDGEEMVVDLGAEEAVYRAIAA